MKQSTFEVTETPEEATTTRELVQTEERKEDYMPMSKKMLKIDTAAVNRGWEKYFRRKNNEPTDSSHDTDSKHTQQSAK